jgi:hypothetical protein
VNNLEVRESLWGRNVLAMLMCEQVRWPLSSSHCFLFVFFSGSTTLTGYGSFLDYEVEFEFTDVQGKGLLLSGRRVVYSTDGPQLTVS